VAVAAADRDGVATGDGDGDGVMIGDGFAPVVQATRSRAAPIVVTTLGGIERIACPPDGM
jgi:hypothetical protein